MTIALRAPMLPERFLAREHRQPLRHEFEGVHVVATPSIRRHVLLAQDIRGGTMFERVGEDWVGQVLAPESLLRMPEIGVEVPLAGVYEEVEAPPASTQDEPVESR